MNNLIPKVSVIMPVYNGGLYIQKAIRSILNQTYNNFEFIIIDDDSTDKTRKIIQSFNDRRIILIKNKQQIGVAKCLNIALNKVNSKYIARMDADDISKLKRLEIQLKYLLNHSDVGVVGSSVDLIDSNGKVYGNKQYLFKKNDIQNQLLKRNIIIHPTVMFQKKLIDKYGGYDVDLNGAEDYDLWLRLAKHTKIINLPDKLLKYRIHPENVSNYAIKRVEKATIKSQIKALIRYKYNILIILYIIRNIISFILPNFLKKKIYVLYPTC